MLTNLLPRQADNNYQGRKLGLWILVVVLVLLALMSANSIFNGYYVAKEVDGLPLDSYTAAGAQAVVSIYATWGLAQLIIVIFSFVALVRYRTLASIIFLLLVTEQIFWRVINHALPIAKPSASSASWFIYSLLALTFIGLILSLWRRRAEI